MSKGKHGGPRPGSGQKPFVADVTAEDALEFIDSVWRDKSLPLAVRLSAAGKAAALRDRSKKKQREEVAVGVESSDRFDMAGPPRLVANRK